MGIDVMEKRNKKNPVAKFMNTVNKSATHRDKTKYFRKEKHKKGRKDPYLLAA